MERNEQIQKSCKIIQRELTKLNKLNCILDLAGHTFTIFDSTMEVTETPLTRDGTRENFDNQIVFELTQYNKPKQ
jgi:hypothetical protein